MLKYTTLEIKTIFESHGCELLDEYQGTFSKMKYRCSCGEVAFTTWNNFSQGKRCGQCTKFGLAKKRSLEEVQKTFKERGCEFLDNEFKSIKHNHRYRCKCGQEAVISFAGFYHQNQYCKKCGIEKNKGSGNPAWRADREKLKQDQIFRKKCYKALQSTLKATNKTKVGHTSDMIGYGPKELQEHVVNHPNWENVKDSSWHLDHIFPIIAFLDYGITDLKLINNLSNLQPISQAANNQKWATYDKTEFEQWLKTVSELAI